MVRRTSNIPFNMLDETSEARLKGRIERLEATIAKLEDDKRRLREGEKLYRSLVEHSISDIITVLEADGTVRAHESPAIKRVLGRQPGERLGSSGFDWIHPDDVELALNIFAEVLDKPGVHPPIEFRVPHADGSWRYLEHTISNLLDDPDIRGIVVASRDITERKALEEQLRHQAFHDSLTNLPNRALFMDRLEHALTRAYRHENAVAVLFLDLNNFKLINDSLGHEVGDQLLIGVAERLKASLRPEDTVARLGGDEFTVLLEDIADENDALQTAARLAKKLKPAFALGERQVFTTASIGIALHTSSKDRPEDMLRYADMAMYHAKREGKVYHLAADPSIGSRQALRRLELEADLRRATDREEFGVHYQPMVRPEDGGIVGMEALVRWEHLERGLLLPSEFVPAAEETGLIEHIGQWVLETVCRQAQTWHEQYPDGAPPVMWANLSAKQFEQPNLADRIAEVLRKTGLYPSALGLEITESVAMKDELYCAKTLQELADLGVRLAIDDFGTGYSSVSHLKRFPVGYVKIDRSFVNGLGKVTNDELVVNGIVNLVRALDMEAIAEGVETAEQAARLREIGCKVAQGYYFSKPLPPQAASALLSTHAP